MELRLVSEPLLRSRMSPLLYFLAPSIPPQWRATAVSPPVRLPMRKSPSYGNSSIHTTARQRAESSSSETDLDSRKDEPSPKPRQTFGSPFAQNRRPSDDILGNQVDNLLDATLNAPKPAERSSTGPVDESSDVMIETAYQNSMRDRKVDKPYQEIARQMQFPSQNTASKDRPNSFTSALNRTLRTSQNTAQRAKRTVRSRPAVGRTIEVLPDRGVDVGRALKLLDIACNQNKIRSDQIRQKFHERPGLKKKRLKSERYRKMFKESFKATVLRVQEMRRKGW